MTDCRFFVSVWLPCLGNGCSWACGLGFLRSDRGLQELGVLRIFFIKVIMVSRERLNVGVGIADWKDSSIHDRKTGLAGRTATKTTGEKRSHSRGSDAWRRRHWIIILVWTSRHHAHNLTPYGRLQVVVQFRLNLSLWIHQAFWFNLLILWNFGTYYHSRNFEQAKFIAWSLLTLISEGLCLT